MSAIALLLYTCFSNTQIFYQMSNHILISLTEQGATNISFIGSIISYYIHDFDRTILPDGYEVYRIFPVSEKLIHVMLLPT